MKINPMKALIELKQKLEEEKQKIENIKNHPCYNCIFYDIEKDTCLCVYEHDVVNPPCYTDIKNVIQYLNENYDILQRIKK